MGGKSAAKIKKKIDRFILIVLNGKSKNFRRQMDFFAYFSSLCTGDGFCDDGNNKYECLWDGGDCCGDNVKTEYCKICECKTCESSKFWKDGFCDDGNNNIGCQFDGGDCCGPNVNKNYCKICECLQKEPRISGSNDTFYYNILSETRSSIASIPAKAQQISQTPWFFTELITSLSLIINISM